jgi:hypothetical protein
MIFSTFLTNFGKYFFNSTHTRVDLYASMYGNYILQYNVLPRTPYQVLYSIVSVKQNVLSIFNLSITDRFCDWNRSKQNKNSK